MNESTSRMIAAVIALLLFVVCVALVALGQRVVGPRGLLAQLAGLAGLIFLLWRYNRKFR